MPALRHAMKLFWKFYFGVFAVFLLTASAVSYYLASVQVKETRQIILVYVLSVTGGMIFMGLILWVLIRYFIDPIKKLTARVAQAGRGDLVQSVDIPTHNELGGLAAAFTNMLQDLQRTTVSRDFMDNILRHMAEVLIVTDAAGRIQTLNPAARQLFGDIGDYQGHDLAEVLARCDLQGELAQVFARKGDIANEEIVFAAETGREKNLLLSIAAIQDRDGRTTHRVCTARDITGYKELERQLRQSQKLESIGQLAAGIAHEINTPAQYVGDNTLFLKQAFENLGKMLQKYAELPPAGPDGEPESIKAELLHLREEMEIDYLLEEVPSALGQSLEGIRIISEIVRAMKEFSHPGSKLKSEADINHALENTIAISRNEWKYHARLETDFDHALPPVPCLIGEFNQVILNLITNARDAILERFPKVTTPQGVIKISTRQVDDWAEIRVSDNGSGIRPEIQEKIFNPFFTTKQVGKGSGQGLAISHNVIVEKHGGSLRVESQPGAGATFIIRLPLVIQISTS